MNQSMMTAAQISNHREQVVCSCMSSFLLDIMEFETTTTREMLTTAAEQGIHTAAGTTAEHSPPHPRLRRTRSCNDVKMTTTRTRTRKLESALLPARAGHGGGQADGQELPPASTISKTGTHEHITSHHTTSHHKTVQHSTAQHSTSHTST